MNRLRYIKICWDVMRTNSFTSIYSAYRQSWSALYAHCTCCIGPCKLHLRLVLKLIIVYNFDERMKQNYLSDHEKEKKHHKSELQEQHLGKLVFLLSWCDGGK